MQKVLDLLEKHVQWVALGLGALWLLFMAWSYVIIPPAQVTIGTRTLTAGNVDEYTVAEAVRPLEEAMKPKEAPPMQVDNFADRWKQRMAWDGVEPIQVVGLIASQPALTPDDIGRLNELVFGNQQGVQPGGTPLPPGTPVPPGGPVQVVKKDSTLPTPAPTATVSDWRFGRSTILVPPPVVPLGQPQPPAPLQPTEADKDWITQSFKVSLPQIDALFKKNMIPPAPIGMTAFLKVEMIRQELLPNGTWGNDKTLQPLPPLNPNSIRQPWPAANAGIHQENAYLNWAVMNTGDIIQPAFYQTVPNKGDPWERPGEAAPLMPGQFNPAMYATGAIPDTLTKEQREAVFAYRREQAKIREQQKRQNRPARQPRQRGVPEMEDPAMMQGFQAPIDAERPKFLQARPYPPRGGGYLPGMYPPGMDPGMMEDPAMMEDPSMYEQPMQQQIMGVGVPDVDYPNGLFDPATWHLPPPQAPGAPPVVNPRPAEVSVWAHDDTVQPGKTYRYKMRYWIKNPLYQQPAAAKNPADIKQFAVASEFSEWGPAIEVPPLTNFFIAAIVGGKIRFDVYTWKQGINHYSRFEVGPGDTIGRPQADIDYSTGHTVVDVRRALRGGDEVVYLAGTNGNTVVRTGNTDRNHPVNKKLKEVVEAAKALQAAALPAR